VFVVFRKPARSRLQLPDTSDLSRNARWSLERDFSGRTRAPARHSLIRLRPDDRRKIRVSGISPVRHLPKTLDVPASWFGKDGIWSLIWAA